MPRPVDQGQVKAFVGMVNYYGQFVPNLSTLLSPIYKLPQKDHKFNWSEACENAFRKVKKALASEQTLFFFIGIFQ